MDSLIRVIAQALDMVEIAYIGASTNHGRRIAVLCAAMGRRLGMNDDELSDLVSCALLHDNALTEYILLRLGIEEDAAHLGVHCEFGQRNVEILPFKGNIEGYIRYHHERADGKGPFKLSEGRYPLGAELIAAADMLDAGRHLERVTLEELPAFRERIAVDIHHRFTERAGQVLLEVLDTELLASLKDDRIVKTADKMIPAWTMDMENPALVPIAALIARIIDYKSNFTKVHTIQIANRAWMMAEYYGYDLTQKMQLYLAAALHDLGKLAIPSAVLEKPGPLNHDEFEIIKTHISHTRNLLFGVEGLGQIADWASNHHEKLNGKGYPLGKTAPELDFNSRLMVCIDIYQAVSEERPYHPRRSHSETISVLYDMAAKGEVDEGIVKDLDTAMLPYSLRDVPPPLCKV
jgi:HD-GYP domain-containing protein (c-di-GMP phosphodiesterase class II)